MKHLFKNLLIVTAIISLSACSSSDGDKVYNITKFGAVADGVTDNAEAIQSAINECHESGGGRVYIPKGEFMTGPLELASQVELHLGVGAKLIANPDESIYTLSAFKENQGEGLMWLYGYNLDDFSITGNGEIKGNGVSFMGEELEDSFVLKPVHEFDPRPHVLTIIGGNNIKIQDVTIGNSAYWTVHLVGCNDVSIQGISLVNNLKVRNGDGIDLDHCKNVRISDCYIESGDDCICLKNRREFEEFGVCENIVVSNCVMASRSCAIKIGSENVDRIANVLFNNCVVYESNRGIGIQNRDEGTVENVIFSNMVVNCNYFSDVWWGKSEPIYVTAYPRRSGDHKDAGWRFPKGATEGTVGNIRNITFSNIICNSENGVFIGGDTQDRVSGIVLDRVELNINKTTNFQGGIYDKRPCNGEEFITGFTAGFFIDNATNVTIDNSSVDWGSEIQPYYTKKVVARGVKGCNIGTIRGVDIR